MAYKRSKNGNKGHSTKAKGVDKRKNEYKTALDKASSVTDVVKVLSILKGLAFDGELPAIKLYLEYYLGKPKETKDITINEIQPLFPDEL